MKPPRSRWVVPGVIVAAIIVIVAGLLLKRGQKVEPQAADLFIPNSGATQAATWKDTSGYRVGSSFRSTEVSAQSKTAEEIVAGKVAAFARKRRDLLYAMAKQLNVQITDEVERFFAALERGNWDEIDAAHLALLESKTNLNQPRSPEIHQIWRPIQEAWGAAREAHNWPAQTLLDYGNSILGSLRPGMVYAGGTDPGCFIPTMLNDTTDGDQHIVLTQNALADGTYLKFLEFQYSDRMATLSQDDSQQAFKQYVEDAGKRFQHDQQFPNEPKQVRPGEDINVTDGRVQVSGQVAVMAINEKLFQMLMEKYPDFSYAMEESFPFNSMYTNATVLGPVMELGVRDEQNKLTAEQATQSVDYWRNAAQQLLSDPSIPQDSDPRKAYSKLLSSQAGLLVQQNFLDQAEQEFRLANELCPASPEAVFRYVNLLLSQGRVTDATQVAENGVTAAPDNKQIQDLLSGLRNYKK